MKIKLRKMSWPGWGSNPWPFGLALWCSNHWATETPHVNHHIQLSLLTTFPLPNSSTAAPDPNLGMAARVRCSRNTFSTQTRVCSGIRFHLPSINLSSSSNNVKLIGLFRELEDIPTDDLSFGVEMSRVKLTICCKKTNLIVGVWLERVPQSLRAFTQCKENSVDNSNHTNLGKKMWNCRPRYWMQKNIDVSKSWQFCCKNLVRKNHFVWWSAFLLGRCWNSIPPSAPTDELLATFQPGLPWSFKERDQGPISWSKRS